MFDGGESKTDRSACDLLLVASFLGLASDTVNVGCEIALGVGCEVALGCSRWVFVPLAI